MLPLSSTARLLIVSGADAVGRPGVGPRSLGPSAGCQVAPPSTETSTPPTTPPPASVAVPVIGHRLAAGDGRAGGRRGDRRGRARRCRSTRVAATRPGLQRRRLRAHVGEQVDRRLLHARVVGGAAAAGRGCRRGPRTTGPCPRRRRARRWRAGTASGGASPSRRRSVDAVVERGTRRRSTVVVESRTRPGGRNPLSRSSSHS